MYIPLFTCTGSSLLVIIDGATNGGRVSHGMIFEQSQPARSVATGWLAALIIKS